MMAHLAQTASTPVPIPHVLVFLTPATWARMGAKTGRPNIFVQVGALL